MKKFFASIGLFVAFASFSSSLSHGQEASKVQIFDSNITVDQVLKAQTGWCNALLKISSTYASGGINAAKPLAAQVINSAYAYQYGPVAFKPTLASGAQTFHPTKEGALASFFFTFWRLSLI